MRFVVLTETMYILSYEDGTNLSVSETLITITRLAHVEGFCACLVHIHGHILVMDLNRTVGFPFTTVKMLP